MKEFIKKIVKHYEEHRESYKTWNEDEMANAIYNSFAPDFKNLCLHDVSIAKRTFCLFPDICGFKGVKTKRCSYKGECEYKTKKAK